MFGGNAQPVGREIEVGISGVNWIILLNKRLPN